MIDSADTATSGISKQLREFDSPRLRGIAENNPHREVRAAARLELTRRANKANALICQAFDLTLPELVREADGMKAVKLTDDLHVLIMWASGFDLPAPVSIAAGLKAVDEAVGKKDSAALEQLRHSAVSTAVRTAASHALRINVWPNPLVKGGVLSKGTVHAPPPRPGKHTPRRAMHTG